MKPIRLALAQWRVRTPSSANEFVHRLDALAATAARQEADLLMLPEYAAAEIGGDARQLADAADALLDGARATARRHGLWLLPGTFLMRDGDGRTRNRAALVAPDGNLGFQDKHRRTAWEVRERFFEAGAPPSVFETPWGRIGIAVCYDIEFPPLVRAQVEAGAWLILCPACTDTMHGFHRVLLSARARAIENQCYVAVAPTVGVAPGNPTLDVNRGYAAVLGPADRGFPEDGILARGALDEEQMVIADLDLARLEKVRAEGGTRNHADWPDPPPACPVLPLE